jgi:alkylation response protein AidB-like acyl-CoA dehydrogenase
MNFAFDDEQAALRDGLRAFVAASWPVAESRRLAGGREPAVWQRLTGELGVAGLAIPEELGGQGGGFLELGIALAELGRELAGGPLFATALAVRALLHGASRAEQAELLPALASGARTATLAFPDVAPRARIEASGSGAELTLRGELRFALDGADAELLLVPARLRSGELALCALERAAPGLAVEPASALDLTRRFGHVALRGARARRLGAGDAAPVFARVAHEAAIAASAEQVGGAERCLEAAVTHARTRYQFGRPIGSFQALKHRLADASMLLDLARAAAQWAWWVAASGRREELAEAAHVAKLLGGEAYARCAADDIHVHGGMGFTWEHDAHLYYRRARALEALFGDAPAHRAELAGELGLAP